MAHLLAGVALVGCAQAQSPVEIADGRSEEPSQSEVNPATYPSMQRAIDAARTYWQGRDPGYEEEVRVLAVTAGAFTQTGVEEQAVLYLMSLWPRCCPKTGVAVFDGERLVRNVAFEGVAQELWGVPDLDGDGRDELVFAGTFGMGGQWSRSVTLAAFGEGGLSNRGTVTVFDDACAAGQPGSTAARVSAFPGPEFVVEHYARATCEATAWEPVGAPEPLVFAAPSENPYADVPVE